MAAVEKKSCKGLKIAVTILALLLAATLAAGYYVYTEKTGQIDALREEVIKEIGEKENQKSVNATLSEENEALYSDNQSLKDEISRLKEEIEAQKKAAEETELKMQELQKQYDELNAQYQEILDEQ